MNSNSDFDTKSKVNYKYCEFCGAPISDSQESPYCERCEELVLFQEVKDFIRTNDVNEFQVAAHFGIPLRMVKAWIKEGRIEYKETAVGTRALNNKFCCETCGVPITFGTLCTKCLKKLNKQNIHGYDMQKVQDNDRMFFLDPSSDKKK